MTIIKTLKPQLKFYILVFCEGDNMDWITKQFFFQPNAENSSDVGDSKAYPNKWPIDYISILV